MLRNWTFRYGGLVIQFVVLSILARHLDAADYGRYLVVLSVVTPLNGLLSLGVSETFVREAPRMLLEGGIERVGSLVSATLAVALSMSCGLALLGGVLLWFLPLDGTTKLVIGFTISMLITTGLAFNAAHMLLGGGYEALGSFFFYPAVNLSVLMSSVPYVVLTESPTLAGVAVVNTSAVFLIAAAATFCVVRRMPPGKTTRATMLHLARVGVRLASIRSLQNGGGWTPTFIAGIMLGPVQAGYLGLASRLALLAGVPAATLRFVARPAIVRAYASGDNKAIRVICGKPAALAFAVASLAVVLSVFIGDWAVRFAFGSDLVPAAPLMTIILIGVAFDAFGGPVDEVLKMTGHEKLALTILCVCVAVAAGALAVASQFGLAAMAWVVTAYFIALSASMIVAARVKLGIWLRPRIRG
jgi:O-antigen/teichoic acid export membrane protein